MNKQYKIDQKSKMLIRANYMCEYCNELGIRCTDRAVESAHRIGQGKQARLLIFKKFKQWFNRELTEKEIDRIVWHEDNIAACCHNKAHNDAFSIHISQRERWEKLLEKICLKVV